MKYIIHDLFESITSFDSKIWRTLRCLILQPGQLDIDYHQGKRVVYLKPISLFLIINVLFVMFSPLNDFYVSFHDQMNLQSYSQYLRPYIFDWAASKGMTVENFESNYDQLVSVLARSLIIIQVPIFGLFCFIINYKKTHYFSDYFIYSLNFHALLMLWVILCILPAYGIHSALSKIGLKNISIDFYFLFLQLGVVAYLIISIKKAYQFQWVFVFIRVIFLILAFSLSHIIFRFLQLLITSAMVQG